MSPFQRDWVFTRVANELNSAARKFKPFNSAHEGWAILYEEVEELWDAVRSNNFDAAQEEAIQVAAMAMRFAIDIDSQKKMDNENE